MGLETVLQSLLYILSPVNLLLILAGTGFGMLCGSLPGISSSMAIILMLPFRVQTVSGLKWMQYGS